MLTTLLALTLLAAGPKSEALPFDLSALKAQPRVTVTVIEKGQSVTYSGVPLARLIKAQLSGPNLMADLRTLSDAAILLKATDDYVAVVSAVEAGLDDKGEKYLIAFERDGKPLSDEQGPAMLVIPGETLRVRWLRMIASASLIHIGTP